MSSNMEIFVQNHVLITLLISLTPAILSIGLAFTTKNVYLSLGLGLYSGIVIDAIVNQQVNFILAFVTGIVTFPIYITESLGSSGNAGIIMQILLISGLIYLLTYTGGLRAMANKIAKYAETREKTQLITWAMGLLIFFDDYANALMVGPVMKNITDKSKISREKLAFIIDATAAPIAGLVIISTWIGYEISLITEQLTIIGLDVPPMQIFLQSIPFRFYNILMLIFIVMTIYMRREFGPMYDAEKRALDGQPQNFEDAESEESEDLNKVEINERYSAKAYEGIVPLIVLITSAFYFFYQSGASAEGVILREVSGLQDFAYNLAVAFSNADTTVVLSQAAFLAIITTFIISRRAFTIPKGINLTIRGASKLIPTAFVLLLAWSLGTIMGSDHLNTGMNIANVLGQSIPYQVLPFTIFTIAAIMAFATGTSYGTMGILFPLSIPLAYAVNPEVSFIVLISGAILTGIIVGDHCSPISDTTLLSSAGADVAHLAHVNTQMPYAILVGVVSAFGYLLSGFIISFDNYYLPLALIYVVLIGIMFIVLKTKGKKVC